MFKNFMSRTMAAAFGLLGGNKSVQAIKPSLRSVKEGRQATRVHTHGVVRKADYSKVPKHIQMERQLAAATRRKERGERRRAVWLNGLCSNPCVSIAQFKKLSGIGE